jgi:hypothetical protein
LQIEWSIPTWGWPALGVLAVLAVVIIIRQYAASEPALTRGWRRLLVLLRSLAAFVLLLALAGPTVYRLHEELLPAEVVLLVEDSSSMQINDAVGGATRWQRALRLASVADSLLALQPGERTVTQLRGNGLEPARPQSRASGPPVAAGTDLQGLIREVSGRWADRPLRGLVLLSDGNETAAPGQDQRPATLGSAKLVVVGVGDPTGPPDRQLAEVHAPDVAFVGEDVVFEVGVTSHGKAPADPIRVQLMAADSLLAEATVAPPEGGGVSRLQLTAPARRPGLHVYRVVVAPLANERYLENNEASLAVDVRKDRSRVLLLSGRPTWNDRFLLQAAMQEERLTAALVRPGPRGMVIADSQGTWEPPVDAAGWQQWDAVVITGWQELRRGVDWQSLAGAVRAGLGLLILPDLPGTGPGNRPVTVTSPPPGPLSALLPMDLGRLQWQRGPWRLLPAGPRQHPVLMGVSESLQPSAGEGRLPPLSWLLPVTPGAEATVLLQAVPARESGGRGAAPVLVLGGSGQGRVAWWGAQPLWELAFWEPPLAIAGEQEQPIRRLLRNLLVWVASGEEEAGLALVQPRQVYAEGERIRLESRWHDLRGAPVTDRQVVVELQPLEESGTATRRFALGPLPDRPGHAQVELPPLPPGEYRVRPLPADGAEPAGHETIIVVTPHSLEAAQVRQDARRLRSLAGRVGGTYLPGHLEDADRRLEAALADFSSKGSLRVIRDRLALAAGWPLLILVVALLGTEWTLRRRQGLL